MADGHGIALNRAHFASLLEHGPRSVGWFELISENFFCAGGRPWSVVEAVRAEVPVSLHGTAMGLGNPEGVSDAYLDQLEVVIQRVQPERVSDHLCFVGAEGRTSHELLPLPMTEEAVQAVSEQILRVHDRLRRTILIENPSSYMRYPEDELSELEFLNEVARRADCGILLDLNNVIVNAHNHGFCPRAFVAGVAAERVGEFHLAGSSPSGRLLIDTHAGPVPEAVWSLYALALEHIGARPTLVEWDTETPAFEQVEAEAARARNIEADWRAGERAA